MYNKFIATYLFDNGESSVEWMLEFYAKDENEAKERIKAIKETLFYDGEVDTEEDINEDE